MNLAVIAPAYYPTDEPIKLLRDSCAIHHLPFYPFGIGRQWRGDLVAHFEGALEAIHNLPSIYDLVMFTDAGDTFVMAGAEEIVEKWKMYGCSVLMAAEQGLYPWGLEDLWASTQALREAAAPPWQYPNGGGWIGRREQLEELVKYTLTAAGEEAQGKWIAAYCQGRFKLDSRCMIFQTMSGDNGRLTWAGNRLLNKRTSYRPVVVHFNGKLGGIQEFYRNAYGQ